MKRLDKQLNDLIAKMPDDGTKADLTSLMKKIADGEKAERENPTPKISYAEFMRRRGTPID